MSNNELLNKFRQLMEKKKGNDDNLQKHKSSPIFNMENNKTQYKEDQSNENSDKNKIPDLSNENSEKIIKNTNDNQQIVNKPRPTVFNLIKKLERRDILNEDKFSPEKKLNENIIEKREHENLNVNLSGDLADYRQRTSTNLKMIRSQLDKAKEELNSSKTSENLSDFSNNKDDYNTANSEINFNTEQDANNRKLENFQNEYKTENINNKNNISLELIHNNIITNIPRLSVKDMIKMNEERVRMINEKKKQQRERISVNKDFKSNVSKISEYLHTLKQNHDDKIDSEEFINYNSEKIKHKFGLNDKEIPIIQELINFYERNAEEARRNKENQLEYERQQKMKRGRNTVTHNNYKRFNLNVHQIPEEKEEDLSMNESARKSKNSNFMNERKSGNIRNSTNYIRKSKNPESSVDSITCLSDDQINSNLNNNFNQNENNEKIEKLQTDSFDLKFTNRRINKNYIFTQSENEIKLSYINSQLNRYSSYNTLIYDKENSNQILLKESGLLNINKSYKITDDSFSVLFPYKKKLYSNFNDFQIKNENEILINPIEKEELLISTGINEINYTVNPKRKIIKIERVNNFEIHRKEKKNKICNDESMEIIFNTLKKNEINQFYLEEDGMEEIMRVKNINSKNIMNKESSNTISNNNIDNAKNNSRPTHRSFQIEENNQQIQNFLSTNLQSSKYQKNIISGLDKIQIIQYNINSSIPLDPIFLDVLCINCYECVKFTEIDIHSENCILIPEEMYKNNLEEDQDEDYNGRIYKLHESLKKKQNEIYKLNNENLIMIYEELTNLIYEILINNNSIEELDRSISQLNELTNNKLNLVNSYYKFTLLIFCKRISQLVFIKLQDMEKILLCMNSSQKLNDSLSVEEEDYENEKQIHVLKLELADLEKQTQSTKIEIEQWKKESKALENMMKKPNLNNEMLSEIVSDVLSRRDESFDVMTMVTGQNSEYENDIANMRDINEVLDLNNEEELKKYFLSIGLSLKFKYADSITENISISDLFDKAKEMQIPISEWYNFIYLQLKIK